MKPVSAHAISPVPGGASRRGFLGLLGGALVATGASLASKAAVAAPRAGAVLPVEAPVSGVSATTSSALGSTAAMRRVFTMSDSLSLDAFSAQLNTRFHVTDANISLELVKASDTSRDDRVRSHQLILRGPLEPVLPPDTHVLRHPVMGDMALFISPFRQDESGTLYHVTFSHLLD